MKGRTIAFIAIGCAAAALVAVVLVVVAGVLLWLLWSRSGEYRPPEPPASVEALQPPEALPPADVPTPEEPALPPLVRPALPARPAPSADTTCPPVSSVLVSASSPTKAPPVAAPAAPPPDSANWVLHADKLGFAVRHPAGWTVETTRDGLIVVRSAERSAVALAAPFFARGTAAQECLMQAPGFLGAILPQARVTKAVQKSRSPDIVLASLAYDAGGRAGRAAMLATVSDRGGMLFAVAAPADQYAAEQRVLVRILETFRFTKPTGAAQAGGAGAGADVAIRYVPWQDPNEQAFSTEVPEGWKVTGGLLRRNAVDPRGCIHIASPDGEVVVSSGDATVPTFSLPGFSQFFPEGSDYSPGYGVVMKVMRFKPGAQFAAEYVQTRVGQTIGDIAVTGTRDRADIAQVFNEVYRRLNSPMVSTQLSMGEVTFTGRYQDKACEGYWFAGTQLTATNMGGVQGGIWTVPNLIGYVATPPKAPLAQAVMMHLIQSSRLNPQWVAMQQGLTANVSDIVTETNKALSNTIIKGHEARQPTHDNASRNWSNMMLGQTDLVDPDTGQTYKAASGHNYYWVRPGSNTGFGTSTSDPPDINVVPLAEW